eukprot:Rmarinus@m.23342
MKTITIALASLAGFAAAVPVNIGPSVLEAPFEGARLVATSENEPAFWVPLHVAEHLGSTGLQFIDVTDTHDLGSKPVPAGFGIPKSLNHQNEVRTHIDLINIDRYRGSLEYFSSYQNRYYTSEYGVASSKWLDDTVREMTKHRNDVTVSTFQHSWAQTSTVLRISAANPGNPDKVILGAHQDSTAFAMPTGSAPGADDDASGSMALVEVLNVLLETDFVPQDFDLEFHWYAAEEVGLRGSSDVANEYANNGMAVRGMMQLDMIGYAHTEPNVAIVQDYTDADQNEFIRNLTDEYLDMPWINTLCGYGCSDHASWNRAGYASSFPFEEEFKNINSAIHTPGDTTDKIDWVQAHEFLKLGVAYAVEMTHA